MKLYEKEQLTNQFKRELEDVGDWRQFLSYFPNSHVQSRHVGTTDKDLLYRLSRTQHFDKDFPPIYSRFFGNMDEVCGLIKKCLSSNFKELQEWNNEDASEAFVCRFDHPIGDGVAKGAKRGELFTFSNITTVLAPADDCFSRGRLFRVISAYPTPNCDEVDVVRHAIRANSERRRNDQAVRNRTTGHKSHVFVTVNPKYARMH